MTGPPGPCGCGCALTEDTSYGFDAVRFMTEDLSRPPRPWQRFSLIHGGELLPDGRPRARIVLLLAARQNGKTEIPVALSLYWQFVEAVPLVLGTSTKLDYARESWRKAYKLAERAAATMPHLDALIPRPRWKRETNGEQETWTVEDSRYKIAASNEEGGRSLTIHRLIADELRQHHDYSAWGAMEPACSPMDAQLWAMTNAGDDRSVVLNELRGAALDYIATGEGDPRLMLIEYSAPDDADPEDIDALLAANPSVGHGLDLDVLLAGARRAKKTGGDALTSFKTERMCIRVRRLNPAIDPGRWAARLVPGGLDDVRDRVAMCLDVSPDMQHATLYAAALLDDDRVRVDYVRAWEGPNATRDLRRDLPALIAGTKPRVLGWMPDGPAAAIAADLVDMPIPGRRWPPVGVTVEAIKGETPSLCMGFVDLVDGGRLVHSGDPLLDAHVARAERLKRGGEGRWVFARPLPTPTGDDDQAAAPEPTHVDAVYAAAGAAHLARQLPPPVGAVRLVVVDD